MSASIMPFMAMQPSRRTSSGWLEISCGAQHDALAVEVDVRSELVDAVGGLSENEVAEANSSVPSLSSAEHAVLDHLGVGRAGRL